MKTIELNKREREAMQDNRLRAVLLALPKPDCPCCDGPQEDAEYKQMSNGSVTDGFNGYIPAPFAVGDEVALFHKDERGIGYYPWRELYKITEVRAVMVSGLGIYEIQSTGHDIEGLIAGFEIESEFATGDNPTGFTNAARYELKEIWNIENLNAPFETSWAWFIEWSVK